MNSSINQEFSRSNNWKYYTLGLLVFSGVIIMSGYKIKALDEANSFFWSLIIFVEAAAGIMVFSQAILRSIDENQGAMMFRWSIVFRSLVALIGLVVFFESETMELSGFLTYELANLIMIFLELMFAKLISHGSIDYALKARTLEKRLSEEEDRAAGLRAILEEARDRIITLEADARESLTLLQRIEESYEVFSGYLLKLAQGKNPTTKDFPEIARELLDRHAGELGTFQDAGKALATVRKLGGKPWTARKNTKGWICPECLEYNEANYSQPTKCGCGREIK